MPTPQQLSPSGTLTLAEVLFGDTWQQKPYNNQTPDEVIALTSAQLDILARNRVTLKQFEDHGIVHKEGDTYQVSRDKLLPEAHEAARVVRHYDPKLGLQTALRS